MEVVKNESCGERVALVAGVTGIVGLRLAELMVGTDPGWARVYGVARRPKPSWFKPRIAGYLQCDLLDREQTLATLSPLTDVTHLFFTTVTIRDTEEENVQANGSMLRNTLDALLSKGGGLRHVSLLTGAKQYLGSFESMLATGGCTRISSSSLPIYCEDEPRLSAPNFYYEQEDILTATAASTQLTWSVHRASVIIGVSPVSFVNVAFYLAAYALICKKEGLPFRFCGDRVCWESHTEFVDSHLVAKHLIWAATHPVAHNQAFNITNGDMVPWITLWPTIASFFNLEMPPPYTGKPLCLVDALRDKAHVWDNIVSQYKLHPTPWEHLSEGWFVLDLCFKKLPLFRLSMEKSERLGFQGTQDSTACLLNAFQELRNMGIIP
ncbi:hypothetical protein L7F22_048512 [Adiantum nelumboides]|nr:hypothetical protein [Adiantum nelumboides]